MRGVIIAVIVYIHTVILPSTGNIPFVFEQKTAHFLYNNKPKAKKLEEKQKKNSKIWREIK